MTERARLIDSQLYCCKQTDILTLLCHPTLALIQSYEELDLCAHSGPPRLCFGLFSFSSFHVLSCEAPDNSYTFLTDACGTLSLLTSLFGFVCVRVCGLVECGYGVSPLPSQFCNRRHIPTSAICTWRVLCPGENPKDIQICKFCHLLCNLLI